MTRNKQEVMHGIDEATYAGDGMRYTPYMSCLCGWGSRGETWGECGEALDAHIADEKLKKGAA